jgi:molecular chaperone DnaK
MAKDRATGNEQKITITSSSGLSKEEVERMARDADSHKAEDEKRKTDIETRNQLDSVVYNTEKTIRDHRDKLAEADIKAAEEAIGEAKKALESGDGAQMKAAHDKVIAASHKMAEAMYQAAAHQAGQPAPDGAPGAQPGGQPSDADAKPGKGDNVVDAEFVDVDENTKK